MKMAAFCDVAPFSVVDIDLRSRGAYCLHHQGVIGLHGATSQKIAIFTRQLRGQN
jgi:hypothetical protein